MIHVDRRDDGKDGHGRTNLWVEQAVGGDRAALKLLLVEARPRLIGHLSQRIPADLKSVIEPDDIIQETYVEVFRRIGSFEPRGSASFYRWIAAIALSRLQNSIKSHRAIKRGGEKRRITPVTRNSDDATVALFDMLTSGATTASRAAVRGEAIQAVKTGLADLPEDYQRAICMVHLLGHSVKETANHLGRSERAIHGLCRRGLKLLQDHLGGLCPPKGRRHGGTEARGDGGTRGRRHEGTERRRTRVIRAPSASAGSTADG